jgi:hypothetical protein
MNDCGNRTCDFGINALRVDHKACSNQPVDDYFPDISTYHRRQISRTQPLLLPSSGVAKQDGRCYPKREIWFRSAGATAMAISPLSLPRPPSPIVLLHAHHGPNSAQAKSDQLASTSAPALSQTSHNLDSTYFVLHRLLLRCALGVPCPRFLFHLSCEHSTPSETTWLGPR